MIWNPPSTKCYSTFGRIQGILHGISLYNHFYDVQNLNRMFWMDQIAERTTIALEGHSRVEKLTSAFATGGA
jgi:hypothetical protein